MKSIDSLYDIQWNSRILIEASAGTGKTYALTALYVRLLLEKNLDVDQILVMTFTKKATAELKERIFRRLKECLYRLETEKESDDSFANQVYDRITDTGKAIIQLQAAIQNFDDSQVFTIHGFCQKILSEEALIAGTPFDFEVTQQDKLLARATEDFWRSFMDRYSHSEAGKYYITKLLEIAKSPKELRDKLEMVFRKPYAKLEGELLEGAVDHLAGILELRRRIKKVWNRESQTIKSELTQSGLSGYTKNKVNKWAENLEHFLSEAEYSNDTFKYLDKFISRNVYDLNNLKKNATRLPNHTFFELCDEYFERIKNIDTVKTTLVKDSIDEIIAIRDKLSKRSNTVTYDDLLKRVNTAVVDSEYAEMLSKVLRQKYPAALVDEFQDTDPLQYSILNSIYPGKDSNSSLVMIGDPKQAIYGFRGADIYTYIKARNETAVDGYTLQKNYRSAPAFNRSVNTLFEYSRQQPFVQDQIDYYNVKSGKGELDEEFRVDGTPACGLRIITKKGVDTNKDGANDFVFSHTVREISNLLLKSERGDVKIKNRKLEAGDIAVLVSSHKSAEEIKRLLKKAGIDSVTYSRKKVFESTEARRLKDVMAAILDPFNRFAVNNALISGFWGQNLNDIYRLVSDGNQRQHLLEDLQELNEVWERDGFYPMFRKLLFSQSRMSKLAQFYNSERILTNLHQLADISAKAEMEGKLDPHSLYSWFNNEMTDPDTDEEKTLLLESDQNLVKISTIHNSKGLEFPVVFCPTLWEVMSGKKRNLFTEYHTQDGDAVIRYDQTSDEESQRAEKKNSLENISEEVRKYYVAVTRAKYHCVIPWANHNACTESGLISSLIGTQRVKKIIQNNLKLRENTEYSDQMVLELFRELENRSKGTINVTVTDEVQSDKEYHHRSESKESSKLYYKSYTGRSKLEAQRRLESFSSLTSHGGDPLEPEYDQMMESYITVIHKSEEITTKSIFTFPRGATAGTAIHKLFEDRNFQFDTALADDHTPLIEKILDQFQMNRRWIPVIREMIHNVVSSDIPGLDLSRVREKEMIREMEFHFTSRQPSLENILKIIRDGDSDLEFDRQYQSFLTGFIDLVVRQDGKYYILDYKSNYLGDSILDYKTDRLKEEIYSANYDLQYHLYTVALWKYLKSRDPEFCYESDFGGVAYLFVRGMRKGERGGIWLHKPDKQVIETLAKELEVQL